MKVFESDASLLPLSFLRGVHILRFRPHYFKRVNWPVVSDHIPLYVGEVAQKRRVRDIFDPHHNQLIANAIVPKLVSGLEELDDETFRNLVIETDCIDRHCFGAGYRAGKERSKVVRPELVNHIVVLRKYRKQVEALLESSVFSGQFIRRKHLERVISSGDGYIADIQGSIFHKIMLTTGVMMTAENPTVKHGHTGMKTHAGHFYKFVCQELPNKTARCGLPEAVPYLREYLNLDEIIPEKSTGFSGPIADDIKQQSRGYCGMTGRILIGSEAFNSFVRNKQLINPDMTFTEIKQKLASDPSCFSRGSADHIIPIAKGGKDTIENGQFACIEANSQKGSRTPYGHTATDRGFMQLVDYECACRYALHDITLSEQSLLDMLEQLDKMCEFPKDLARMSRQSQVKAIMNKDFEWKMYNRERSMREKDKQLLGLP